MLLIKFPLAEIFFSRMSPIIPAEHQRISISYIDDDKNNEAEYVLLTSLPDALS